MIQQAIDNMDEQFQFILDEDIDIELGSIVKSLDLAKLGEGDISAKELINIDSMEPIDETYIDDHEIVSQVLNEGNDKPIDNVVSKYSRPLLATAQAAIRTLQDYANCEGKENLLHNIEQLKQIMPSEPKQVSIVNFLHRNKFYHELSCIDFKRFHDLVFSAVEDFSWILNFTILIFLSPNSMGQKSCSLNVTWILNVTILIFLSPNSMGRKSWSGVEVTKSLNATIVMRLLKSGRTLYEQMTGFGIFNECQRFPIHNKNSELSPIIDMMKKCRSGFTWVSMLVVLLGRSIGHGFLISKIAAKMSLRHSLADVRSESNEEWYPRNVYDDFDILRQRIIINQADDNLRQIKRRHLMNAFAKNRRPLLRDVGIFVLPPMTFALVLALTASHTVKFRKLIETICCTEFWIIGVAAPLTLWWEVRRSVPKKPKALPDDEGLLPRRARALYSTLIQLNPMEDQKSIEAVMNILELWVSAMVGVIFLPIYLRISATGPLHSELWPFFRFITRLGAIASLHQYPKLLYDLRTQFHPRNKFEGRLIQLITSMLKFSAIGLAFDLSGMMLVTQIVPTLIALSLMLVTLCDFSLIFPTSGLSNANPRRALPTKWLRIFRIIPFLIFTKALSRYFRTTMKSTFSYQIIPLLIPIVIPILHIIAALKLLRIQKTHDISLARKDIRFIINDTDAMRRRIKWRYRLEWRDPPVRLFRGINRYIDDWFFNVLFVGGVPDKLLNFSRDSFRKETKDLINKIQELDQYDPIDSKSWKKQAMDNLAKEHQEDYEKKVFRDPLGVAVQQTFGIGLGFADGYLDPPKQDSEPTGRRLQARAAKSAILRMQEVYDAALEMDFDGISDYSEREKLKAAVRQREEAEKVYLTSQMKELIPLEDEDDNDDSESQLLLPRKSIRQMYRSMLKGVSEYEELFNDEIPWQSFSNSS